MSIQNSSADKVKTIVEICEDVKAADIQVYDMTEKSTIADYCVICTGKSDPHLRAIADQLYQSMKSSDELASHVDGDKLSKWVVLDFNDVIVHLFHPEARAFYKIEEVWKAKELDPENLPWECKDHEILEEEIELRTRFY